MCACGWDSVGNSRVLASLHERLVSEYVHFLVWTKKASLRRLALYRY